MKRIGIKNVALCLILVLSVLASTGCDAITIVDNRPADTANITPTDSEESIPPPTNEGAIDSEWSIPPTESQAQLLPSIADVVARVKPSVVAINSEVTTRAFFDRSRSFTQEVPVGSGWIISEDGYVVTNNHVAEASVPNIIVILDDGRAFPAEIVGADELTDLAVLKINAENLPVVQVGDSSEMRVGDWVVAIGNALGEGTRATQGIVSRQDVSIPVDYTQMLYGLIETDAAINPGNSGGPLVNMAGEVIGITSAKLAAVEIEATGYAISTEAAMPIIQQLINTGYAIHPWLGVSLYPVDQYVVERFNLTIDRGAFVVEVVADSPAGTAGLQPDDVIVSFAGKEIDTVDDLIQAIRSAKVGQEVAITYWRGDTETTTTATLIERP
ncbi:putative serine protease HtrA [subsurface metagenome]